MVFQVSLSLEDSVADYSSSMHLFGVPEVKRQPRISLKWLTGAKNISPVCMGLQDGNQISCLLQIPPKQQNMHLAEHQQRVFWFIKEFRWKGGMFPVEHWNHFNVLTLRLFVFKISFKNLTMFFPGNFFLTSTNFNSVVGVPLNLKNKEGWRRDHLFWDYIFKI